MDVSSKGKSAWRGDHPVYHDQSCSSGRYICPSVYLSKSRPVPFCQQNVRDSRGNGDQLLSETGFGCFKNPEQIHKKDQE